MKFKTLVKIFFCLSVTALLISSFFTDKSSLHPLDLSLANAQNQASKEDGNQKPAGLGGENYPTQSINEGVWNGGQAAPWDLHIIDHFRYFGAEERARGYKPEQPIPFSHITHVKQNQMECQYCHRSVDKSPYAAIPEGETCMGCHQYMDHNPANSAEVQEYQKSEIAKVRDYYTQGHPIPGEKVHVMPNHVKFNHKRHIAAGVTCQSCHGQIPEMPVVERVSSMKMGWCIDCHRQQGASIDCTTCHY